MHRKVDNNNNNNRGTKGFDQKKNENIKVCTVYYYLFVLDLYILKPINYEIVLK